MDSPMPLNVLRGANSRACLTMGEGSGIRGERMKKDDGCTGMSGEVTAVKTIN